MRPGLTLPDINSGSSDFKTGSNAANALAKRGLEKRRRPGRLWARRLLFACCVCAGLYGLRLPLLRGWAALLVADEPLEARDYVLALDGEHCCAEAARLYHQRLASGILLIPRHSPARSDVFISPSGPASITDLIFP